MSTTRPDDDVVFTSIRTGKLVARITEVAPDPLNASSRVRALRGPHGTPDITNAVLGIAPGEARLQVTLANGRKRIATTRQIESAAAHARACVDVGWPFVTVDDTCWAVRAA